MNILSHKKILSFLLLTSIILSVFTSDAIHANITSSLYKTDKYSVNVSDELETDAETLQDYTSFFNDNVHIGITVSDNITGENVTALTETDINDIATKTLHAVLAQSGEGINIKEHSLVTFSDRAYPALHVSFEGSSELDASVYIEEYIITTISYKYTVVFSADSRELLDCDAVHLFKSSFTTTEEPLKLTPKIEENTLTHILLISLSVVIILFVVTVFIIINKQKKTKKNNNNN